MIGVSFIVPVYNGEATIRDTLNSLLSQDLELPFEIIVVNNNSNDKTLQILKEFSQVKILHTSKEKSRSIARNLGAKNSTYNILAFIDCDVQISHDWASTLLKVLKHPFAAAQTTIRNKSLFRESENHYLDPYSPFQTMDSCSLIIFKNIFFEAEGFNESLKRWEDSHLTMKLLCQGYSLIVIDPAKAIKIDQRKIFEHYVRIFETGLSEGMVLRSWFHTTPSFFALLKIKKPRSKFNTFIQILGQKCAKSKNIPLLMHKSGWTIINKNYAISRYLNILITPEFICIKSISNNVHYKISNIHPDFHLILDKIKSGNDFWDDLLKHFRNDELILQRERR